jgi:hypothetical protein
MKTYRVSLILVGLVLAALAVMSGCKEDPPTSLYEDPATNVGTAPQPVVSAVDPPGAALAGVTTVTITGSNFSAVSDQNLVFFDATKATILSASTTQLVVRAPTLVKDSVTLRVMVYKAESASAPRKYTLLAAVTEYGGLGKLDDPYGIATDAAGNMYVSISGSGVKKITPDGTKTDYSAHAAGVTKWSALKMGPAGVLYTARILRVIYQVPAGGGAPVIWVTGSSIGNIYDMDFDANGNLWAGGNNAAVYCVKQDKSVKQFPFTCNARSMRVYNGYLYVGGKVDTTEGVWRAQIINPDSLGTFEKYFDFTAKYPGYVVNAVTFAADGDMYIGTDNPSALIVVHPSKVAEPVYPGLFTPSTLLFTWGNADDLYMIRTVNNPRLLKVTMLKNGAPYYGKLL